jgi:methylmalonyl-CoA mutase cobalamin-binding subunit
MSTNLFEEVAKLRAARRVWARVLTERFDVIPGNAGMSVIYTGPWQSTEAIVSATVQDDPDAIGFNAYSGDHALIPKELNQMAK